MVWGHLEDHEGLWPLGKAYILAIEIRGGAGIKKSGQVASNNPSMFSFNRWASERLGLLGGIRTKSVKAPNTFSFSHWGASSSLVPKTFTAPATGTGEDVLPFRFSYGIQVSKR